MYSGRFVSTRGEAGGAHHVPCFPMKFPSRTLAAFPLRRIAAVSLCVAGCVASPMVAAQAAASLDQVVVTGSRFSDDPRGLPFGVSVITAQDIRRSGAGTVNEAVMKLLGVPGRLDLYGGGEYALDLRGFGSTSDSNMVIVVDGLRLSEGDLGGTRLAGIPIDTVERIEVLRGSGAVLYGEGATGGVVIITTKAGRGVQRRNTAQVHAAAGSHSTRELRAAATLVAGDFSVDVAGNRRLSDGHRDNGESATRGGSVAAQWATDGLRVVLRHGEDRLGAGLPGALSTAQYDSDPTQSEHPNDWVRIINRRSSLQADWRLGDWEFGVEAGQRAKQMRSLSTYFGSASNYDYDVAADQVGARARYSATLGSLRNSLAGGVDVSHWDRDVAGTYGSSARQTNRAVYLRDDLTLEGGTRLSAGLRREAIKKTHSGVTAALEDTLQAWELGLVQPLAAQWQAYGRLGRSFRLANADEFSYTSGTPLRPQMSRDVELGARWRAERDRADLRLYRSSLRDEIGYDPAANGGWGANVNYDPTRRQGIELEGSHALTPALELRATAAWRQATFVGGAYDGKDVPLVNAGSASLGAQWQVLPGHRLGANLVYASSRHPDLANSCSMPSVTTLDLRWAWELPVVELSVAVGNATDRKFYTQAYACANGLPTSIYPEPGRSVTAAARLNF